MSARTVLTWLKIGTTGGPCEYENQPSGSMKTTDIVLTS
jgi:hypothetical protein